MKTKNDCKEIPCIKTPILRAFGAVLTVFWNFFENFPNFFLKLLAKYQKKSKLAPKGFRAGKRVFEVPDLGEVPHI